MTQTIYCKRHPDTETGISCGRCGDSICARCLVHSPVGVRCPDCGRSRPAPTFDVSPVFIIRGALAGGAVTLVGSATALALIYFAPIPYLPPLLVIALGFCISEAISLATNRKRGTRLKIIAVLCILVMYIAIVFITGATFGLLSLLAGGVAFYWAMNRF